MPPPALSGLSRQGGKRVGESPRPTTWERAPGLRVVAQVGLPCEQRQEVLLRPCTAAARQGWWQPAQGEARQKEQSMTRGWQGASARQAAGRIRDRTKARSSRQATLYTM
eukprot:scaffold2547_cov299-Prasinococcus_capsulatus_cf.AAC.2